MTTHLLPPSGENIEYAARLVAGGQAVGMPTETVYGLAANALSDEAVRGIFEAKGRPQDNPLIVHVEGEAMLNTVAADVPAGARKLISAFWPGPLTLVLPRAAAVAGAVSAGLDTVAVRQPAHPVARGLIRASGLPLAAPSANRSGAPSPTTARHVMDDLEGRIPAVLDGGACAVGIESTVVSLARGAPVVLRPGFVTVQELSEALGEEVRLSPMADLPLSEGEAAESPGMKYRHYAPRAEITIIDADRDGFMGYVAAHAPAQPSAVALCFEQDTALLPVRCVSYGLRGDVNSQAAGLFAALRGLDDIGAHTVWACRPETGRVGQAVYNRLLRAAGFRVVRP